VEEISTVGMKITDKVSKLLKNEVPDEVDR